MKNRINLLLSSTRLMTAVLLVLAGLLAPLQPTSADDGKFVNLSTRGWVGTGGDVRIVGFIIEDDSRQVLIQALGPELINRGISNAVTDPVLTVTNTTDPANPMELMVNDNWEDSQGQLVSDLWGGSPPLSAGSLSSAVVLTLEPGNYTAKVEGKNGTTGVAIVEVYRIASTGEGSPDREALTAFYNAMGGANWTNNDNWLSDAPLDQWYGVTVDDNGRVIELSLDDNQLSGSIPPELGDLANLQSLDFDDNQLNGTIPPELSNLANLEVLWLAGNELSGPIPPELGNLSNLQNLDLDDNQLSGSIPSQLGELANLRVLWLTGNQLSGVIPMELGKLSNLLSLDLAYNQLSGSIPPELGRLTNLETLGLHANQLSGSIPSQLGELANLVGLGIQDNRLSGMIPEELGNLANLQTIYLGGSNQFSGCIPDGLREVANNDLSTLGLLYCGDGGQEITHGVGATLSDLPSGSWDPDVTRDGSFNSSGGNVTIRLDDGGYIEEGNYRYTCQDSGGCVIENRGVTSGMIVQTTQGTSPGDGGMGTDTKPGFATGSGPGNQSYTVDTAISTLTLPEASGGDGTLTYSLTPNVPGLSFNHTTRRLTGTPTTAGTYDITYTVTDADGDTDTLSFTITVENPRGNIVGNFHLHDRHFNSRGFAYANNRFYFLNWLSDKAYAYTGTGQHDPEKDIDLTLNVDLFHRLAYANGRFYIFHLQGFDGKLFAYTITGQRDASNDLELHPDNGRPQGIAYADGRFYVVDQQDHMVYAYTASGDRDPSADFALAHAGFVGSYAGIAYVEGRFHVLDDLDDKVYAYTISGDRDATADFALACDNFSPIGIAYASGGFHVFDWVHNKIYTYTGTGGDINSAVCFLSSNPGDQSYPIGTAISALTLPRARSGDEPLTYSLLPEVPGLSFDHTTRRLTGTPSRVGTYEMTYRASDVDGDTDSLTFTITVTEPQPDLVVESATVSNDTPDAGASFTLSATVRNTGGGNATATTLRYFRSSDSRISSTDTEVGTDAVGALSSSGTSAETILLTAPSSPGTYYYGACVDSVSGESNTSNNCSSAVRVIVSDGTDPSYTLLERWWVYPNGLVNFVAVTIGPGDCVNVNGSTLNGVIYTVHSTKWQHRASAASSWEDVPDTEQQGKVCSYIPTTPGQYRMVGDITRGGTRGNYSSDTITIN